MIGYASTDVSSQRLPAGVELLFPAAEREWRENEERGDFIAVIGEPRSTTALDAMERVADRIGLPFISLVVPTELLESSAIADLRRSDHASFWSNGFPAMMITDTADFRYSAYHCASGPDSIDRLDMAFATRVTQATVGAVAEILGMR